MRMLYALLASSVLIGPAWAEKNATIESKIASIDSPTWGEDFDGALDPVFRPAKGEWKIEAGALTGRELKSDKHAAVLNLQKKNRNSVIRFSFKLEDETKGLHLSLNHAGGHLFRVIVTPAKVTLNLDKDKKDPQSKAQRLAESKANFAQGQWHTMQVEMVGDRVIVQTDNGATLEAKHKTLDTAKPNYRFVMRGKTLSIDDVQLWELK